MIFIRKTELLLATEQNKITSKQLNNKEHENYKSWGSDALCSDYKPSGSTCLEICRASEVARSVLAGVTAKIRHVSLVMNWNNMSLICASMSTGWSPTGTLVRPGRSIMVMFNTATHNHWLYIHLTDKFTSPKVTRNPTRQCLMPHYWGAQILFPKQRIWVVSPFWYVILKVSKTKSNKLIVCFEKKECFLPILEETTYYNFALLFDHILCGL